jgi:hypothetical protein
MVRLILGFLIGLTLGYGLANLMLKTGGAAETDSQPVTRAAN